MTWLDENFVSILNGLARASLLFTMASGLALIAGLMDVLNLAHGAIFLVGGYFAVEFASNGSISASGLALALVFGLAIGLVISRAVRPLAPQGHAAQVLLTLGLTFVLTEIAIILWGADFKRVNPPGWLSGTVDLVGHTYPKYRVFVIVVGISIALALWIAIDRTLVGAILRASVSDLEMVELLGHRPARIQTVVFLAGTALAALGGVLGAGMLSVSPGLDGQVLSLALVVLAIGGTSSLKGAMVASIIVGQVESLGRALFPEFAGFALFALMAAVLVVRPQGLFGATA
jgi:branched-chain amino acid transport system permease protein